MSAIKHRFWKRGSSDSFTSSSRFMATSAVGTIVAQYWGASMATKEQLELLRKRIRRDYLKTCKQCHKPMFGMRHKQYCSANCRWQARHTRQGNKKIHRWCKANYRKKHPKKRKKQYRVPKWIRNDPSWRDD